MTKQALYEQLSLFDKRTQREMSSKVRSYTRGAEKNSSVSLKKAWSLITTLKYLSAGLVFFNTGLLLGMVGSLLYNEGYTFFNSSLHRVAFFFLAFMCYACTVVFESLGKESE